VLFVCTANQLDSIPRPLLDRMEALGADLHVDVGADVTTFAVSATRSRWSEALELLGNPSIHRIVITHYHPDHIGCGGLLADLVEPNEIVQGRLDAALSKNAWVDMDIEGVYDHMFGNGMSAEMAREAADDEGGSPVTIPEPTHLVDEGDIVNTFRTPRESVASFTTWLE
jgi:glyoxylase-like metal-dependent hydrolase (beta-lactamase superfamily II)